MSADGQLAAFIDRMFEIEPYLDRISDPIARLEYVLTPLAQKRLTASVAWDRAVVAAGRLIGCRSDTVRHRAKIVRKHGGLSGALLWAGGSLSDNVWPVSEWDPQAIGQVYVMKAVDFPGIVKVGFSHDPDRRIKELEWQHKIRLSLLDAFCATQFDEHLVQHRMATLSLANEWFDLDGRWSEASPYSRFFTPDRMWRELREAV